MNKHFFICLIAVLIPHFAFSASSCYEGEENCWECGNDCTARFDPSTSTFNVSGTGKMADLATGGQAANVPWYSIRSSVKNITFEGALTSFSTYAFYGMQAESVTIPDSVTYIGFGAFYKASALKNVDIPDSVTHIHYAAFSNTNLESIVIPDSVADINSHNLKNNAHLTSVIMSDQTKIVFNSDDVNTFNENITIYCTGDFEKCKEQSGIYADQVVSATTKQINGVTYVYDKKGKLCAKSGVRQNKRIYTIEEAEAASKENGNIFKLKYK